MIQDGNRCGEKCGGSFTLGAIIYFPVSDKAAVPWSIMASPNLTIP